MLWDVQSLVAKRGASQPETHLLDLVHRGLLARQSSLEYIHCIIMASRRPDGDTRNQLTDGIIIRAKAAKADV